MAVFNDVFEVSQLDLRQVTQQVAPFDLSQLARDLVAEYAAAAASKGIALRLRLPETELGLLHGDVRMLRQATSHVLDNALRFTDVGQVDLMLDCTQNEDCCMAIALAVRDTGVGLAESDLSLIFDRFTQADNSKTRPHDGAGLGLSLAKSYVELLGGTITVESDEGVGCCFTISVVFDIAEDATPTPQTEE